MPKKDKRLSTRMNLWPDSKALVYDPNKADGDISDDERVGGYSRIPRILPMAAALVNRIGGTVNAGSLLQVLWSHDFGYGFLDVSAEEMLFEAGYSHNGKRADRNWKERMEILVDLGLVKTKRRRNQEHGYILLIDPYLAISMLKVSRPSEISEPWWNHFIHHCTGLNIPIESYKERALAIIEAEEEVEE